MLGSWVMRLCARHAKSAICTHSLRNHIASARASSLGRTIDVATSNMAAPKCLLLFALLCAAALGGRDAARPPKPPLPPSPPPRVINNCPSCTRSMLLLGDSFSDGGEAVVGPCMHGMTAERNVLIVANTHAGLPYGLWSLDNSTYPYAQYGDVSAYYQGRFSNGLGENHTQLLNAGVRESLICAYLSRSKDQLVMHANLQMNAHTCHVS